MSTKDFKAIADSLHKSKPAKDEFQYASKYVQWQIDCQVIAMACSDSNPKFNQDLFMRRCRVGT